MVGSSSVQDFKDTVDVLCLRLSSAWNQLQIEDHLEKGGQLCIFQYNLGNLRCAGAND